MTRKPRRNCFIDAVVARFYKEDFPGVMSGEAARWQRVRSVFQAALDRPDDDRARFLRELCSDDSDLRREVESLLDAHRAAPSHFMDRPAIDDATGSAAERLGDSPQELTARADLWSRLPIAAGNWLGAYQIGERLGEGGMGVVYRARDSRLRREVALKILPPAFAVDAERLKRFEREGRVIAALNHPNIVTIYSVEAIDGLRFFTMELVNGRTLAEVIQGRGLDVSQLLKIAIPLADAVYAAHQRGITHRDLKPTNVMLTHDDRVKVLDFGIAKLLAPEGGERSTAAPGDSATGEGRVIGTTPYVSPEQAEGRSVDHRSDIFSLGVVLYELATGTRPFTGDSRLSLLSSIVRDTPRPITSLNPSMPADLARIVRRCLVKDATRRYQTAADLRNELEEIQTDLASGGKGVNAGRPASPSKPLLIACIAAVAIIVAFAWGALGSKPTGAASFVNFTRVTAEPGVEDYPAISPDGKWIAYDVGDRDHPGGGVGETAAIYLRSVVGQTAINLTKELSGSQPAFSPDGNQIAFRLGGSAGGIYVMGLTGESPRRVTDAGANPAWSPDGREIAYATQEVFSNPAVRVGTSQLWIATIETGTTRRLMTGDAVQPHWSPHGRRIAYWGLPDARRPGEIFTIAVSGGEAISVTSDAAFDWNPVWSPDGRYLYFSSNRSGSFNLWRVRIDEDSGTPLSAPEAVTTPSSFVGHFSFSADGRRIAYASIDRTNNIQRASFDPNAGVLVSDPVWVTTGSRTWFQPYPSPDNQWVAFISGAEQFDLFVARTDGSSVRQLTDDRFADLFPRWSPDGRLIAFGSDRGGRGQVWVTSPDGSGRRQITNYSGSPSWHAWSPDGSRMVVSDIDRQKLLIFDPNRAWDSQTPQEVSFPEGRRFYAIEWSPDSEWLAGFDRGDPNKPLLGLATYSLRNGAYRWLTEYWGGHVTWLNDSRRIVFASNDGKLVLVDQDSKQKHDVLATSGDRLEDPVLSRDNRTLYFTRARTESDIWTATPK